MRNFAMFLSGCLAAVSLASAPVLAQSEQTDRQVPTSRAEIQLSFAPVVRRAAPAVVNIYTKKVVRKRASPFAGDPFFERFFQDFGGPGFSRSRIESSLGSGVIVRPEGIVVSNHHVVGEADEITVVLADGREVPGEVILSDEQSDLSVVRLEGVSGLPALEFHDSNLLEVGDLVLAIGNPFGVGQTVTSGIVSALARSGGVGKRGYFIQTDAAINPGNSGGALVDLSGRLVGVNTSILTRSGGSNGIGFAVPANLVARVVADAVGGATRLNRPWTGMQPQMVDGDVADSLGMPRPEGVLVAALHPASPLMTAGLKSGDVIQAIDGQPIRSLSEFDFRLAARGVGGSASIGFFRLGETAQATVPLIAPPDTPAREVTRLIAAGPLSGALIANLNPALGREINAPPIAHGVVILEAAGASGRIGARAGDIIRKINGADVDVVSDAIEASRTHTGSWRLMIERDGQLGSIVVQG